MNALLTIDDIASKNTPAIVDYLNEKGIRAIMFAVGKNLRKYPEEAALLAPGSHHIILMHAHDETEELFPEYYRFLIDHLLECGVRFMAPEMTKERQR